ncbi:hypothetical protein Clacol_008586 [Clathrus columnatus]|uniref:Osmotin thaumatin-like protein n=1 Tax=Clathrus columnatus TaxID=1419009 RepID=A0AAV5AKX5_9AGAM|nr:hypothetical protein Clacol_008586 [Clathrus columnatus]
MPRLFNYAALVSVLATAVTAATLNVVNKCNEQVFLFTQTSFGSIANNIFVNAGATQNMGISSNWDGAINELVVLPTFAIPGSVTYDISLIYGYNVGMEITGCEAFACTLPGGCPVPGPSGSCYSGCCTSAAACSGGALPAGGGGCPNNAFAGPHSNFFYGNCPNAYAFPDNDGANGGTPANNVDTTCATTSVTLTLCPGTTSHL